MGVLLSLSLAYIYVSSAPIYLPNHSYRCITTCTRRWCNSINDAKWRSRRHKSGTRPFDRVFVYSLKCGFRRENASRNFHTIDRRCDAILSVWVTDRFFLHFTEKRTTCLDFPVERSFDRKIENVKRILRILLIHVILIINLYFSYLKNFIQDFSTFKSFNWFENF